ncbi:MAG: photosynthetic reaction center subunit H [Rhodospirillales bacterium]|jgi:photosynthetic reaction center H subunit
MEYGAITSHIDVAQVALYAFWVFFAGLIVYLHRENKREGYPLIAEDRRSGRVKVQGWPAVPAPKTFRLEDGRDYLAPPGNTAEPPLGAVAPQPWPGSPLIPLGDPLRDAIGPAAYALREDKPDTTGEGKPRIIPMRTSPEYSVAEEDVSPVGMTVIAADRKPVGVVRDLWIDMSELGVRYLETEITVDGGTRRVLVPLTMAKIDRDMRLVRTGALLAHQFAHVPGIANPDIVTKLEEDKITAYFGGGYFYATKDRSEPLL